MTPFYHHDRLFLKLRKGRAWKLWRQPGIAQPAGERIRSRMSMGKEFKRQIGGLFYAAAIKREDIRLRAAAQGIVTAGGKEQPGRVGHGPPLE